MGLASREDWARALVSLVVGGEADGFVELRSPGLVPAQEFHPVGDLDAIVASALRRGLDGDVWIGAAPRVERKGGKAAIRQCWALWADFDGNAEALDGFKYPPTMTVASGSPGHVHAWWALERPLDARIFERANRRLIHHLGADAFVYDVARILRIPGTLNHKTDPPRVVAMLSYTGAVYAVGDLVARLPDPPEYRPKVERGPMPRLDRDDPLRAIPAPEWFERLTGEPADTRRKVACPLHGDTNPSMILDTRGGFYCYGCTAGGSIYDFAAALWGMGTRGEDFKRLRERLEREFGIASS